METCLVRPLVFLALLLTLSACMGSEKGKDVGLGFDVFNTQSKEDKENDDWFSSFYGKNHCHGQWAGDCKPEESNGGGSSGGMWGGGVGPSDSGSSASHSDSGSSSSSSDSGSSN